MAVCGGAVQFLSMVPTLGVTFEVRAGTSRGLTVHRLQLSALRRFQVFCGAVGPQCKQQRLFQQSSVAIVAQFCQHPGLAVARQCGQRRGIAAFGSALVSAAFTEFAAASAWPRSVAHQATGGGVAVASIYAWKSAWAP